MKCVRPVMGTLALLVLAASLASADEAEERALQTVKRLRGKITRDESAPGMPVVAVDLLDTRPTAADLKELAGLKQLQSLRLPFLVTDAHLKSLTTLTELQTLELVD